MDVVLWRMVPWRPRFRPQRRYLRSLLTFGGAATGVAIMASFLAQFDNIVVGRVLGVAALGYYSMATKLPYLFIVSLSVVAGQVMFPAFASLRDDEELKRAFLSGMRYTAMVALPLTAALVVLAEPLTVGVFGPRWGPAVNASRVLCVWAVVSPISMVCGNLLRSRGRADIILWIAIPQAIGIIVGSLLVAKDGIIAVSWLQAAIAVLAQIVTMAVVQRKFKLSTFAVLGSMWPPFTASVALAAVLFAIDKLLVSPWPVIIAGGVLGAVTYAGVLHLAAPDMFPKLRSLAFPGAGSPQTPESALAAGDVDSVARPTVAEKPAA